jgi:hypothetical protein
LFRLCTDKNPKKIDVAIEFVLDSDFKQSFLCSLAVFSLFGEAKSPHENANSFFPPLGAVKFKCADAKQTEHDEKNNTNLVKFFPVWNESKNLNFFSVLFVVFTA